ncbi:hypothetical protein RN001_014428 [Aquatica leii]|uniref:F-box domain-containing protein n=1 Tax=Aquatica leii TaxID=1421715 RepID=A0AAN7SBM0_9COLE|nr:hypothetical protein RN001_014428 [Aquatica leii]
MISINFPELKDVNEEIEVLEKEWKTTVNQKPTTRKIKIIKIKYEKEIDIWKKLETLKEKTKENREITLHKIKNRNKQIQKSGRKLSKLRSILSSNNMTSFNDLPAEIITEIFLYLPRKDRLICSKVCRLWNGAVNSPYLWRSMVIYLDSDLTEPSTTLVTRAYHEYFKAMEFCWSNPRLPARWMQHDLKEFSKRACQYIMILQNSYIQLHSIKIVDWYEVPYLKKIIYHLCKFIKSQLHLVRVSFFNTNFYKPECVKLLSACLTTVNTIHYLDISNCHHPNPVFYNPVPMKPCFDYLHCLQTLKVDYTAFSSGLMDALLIHKNTSLKYIDLIVRENDYLQSLISGEAWERLHTQCPNLKVAIHISITF